MSTWWYFECLDHDPPLRSDYEFSQHTDDEYYRAAVELANSRPLDPEMLPLTSATRNYFENNARMFLVSHPTCRLELVSENGERRPVGLPDEQAVAALADAIAGDVAELRRLWREGWRKS